MNMNREIIPEYCQHNYTIAIFPIRGDIWRNGAYYAQKTVLEAVYSIAKHEKVILCVRKKYRQKIEQRIGTRKNITIVSLDTDDIWARDITPTFIIDEKKIKGVCWRFNAWNGLYRPYRNDKNFGKKILKHLNIKKIKSRLILEGGSIVSNGDILLTTKEVLLKRNPNRTQESIEIELKQLLGVNQVIWIDAGLMFDETGGHIDNFLSFVNNDTILLSWTDDINNPQYNVLNNALNTLKNIKNENGNAYKIIKLPLPNTSFIRKEEANQISQNKNSKMRLAGDVLLNSYSNSYIFNGGIVVPTFNLPTDNETIEIYKNCFPDKTIYPINARELSIGGGGFHCIFHEVPIYEEKNN